MHLHILQTYIESVKQVIAIVLIIHEHHQILEHPLVHRHFVVVANGILSEEVKLDHKLFAIALFV